MAYGPVSQYPVNQVAYPAYQQPHYEDPADSVGSWMLAQFIVGIPVVGFVYLLVVAFGGSASVSRRNWARATFAWMLIGVLLTVVAFVLVAVLADQGTPSSS